MIESLELDEYKPLWMAYGGSLRFTTNSDERACILLGIVHVSAPLTVMFPLGP
jgi:hypothetical protein